MNVTIDDKTAKTFGIPLQYTGYRDTQSIGTASIFKKLAIGQCVCLPKKARNSSFAIAKNLKIKIVTRGLGSKDKVYFWRVA